MVLCRLLDAGRAVAACSDVGIFGVWTLEGVLIAFVAAAVLSGWMVVWSLGSG